MDARNFVIKPEVYEGRGGIKTPINLETAQVAEMIRKHYETFSKAIYIIEVMGPSYNIPELPARYLKKIEESLNEIKKIATDGLKEADDCLTNNGVITRAEYNTVINRELTVSSALDNRLIEIFYAANDLWIAIDTLRITGIMKFDDAVKNFNKLSEMISTLAYNADKYSKLIIIKRIEIINASRKKNDEKKGNENDGSGDVENSSSSDTSGSHEGVEEVTEAAPFAEASTAE